MTNIMNQQLAPNQLADALKQALASDIKNLDSAKQCFAELAKVLFKLQAVSAAEIQFKEVFSNVFGGFEIEKSLYWKATASAFTQSVNVDQAQVDVLMAQSLLLFTSFITSNVNEKQFAAFDKFISQQLDRQMPVLACQYLFSSYVLVCSQLPIEHQKLVNFDVLMLNFNQQTFTLDEEMTFLSLHKEIANQYSFLFSSQIFASVFEKLKQLKQKYSFQNNLAQSDNIYVQCPFGDYVPENQQSKKAQQSNISVGMYQELSDQVSELLNIETYKTKISIVQSCKQKFSFVPQDCEVYRVLSQIMVYKQLLLVSNSIFSIQYQDCLGDMPVTMNLMKQVINSVKERKQAMIKSLLQSISQVQLQGLIENALDYLIKFVAQDQSIANIANAITTILQIYSFFAQVGDFIYLTTGTVQYREVIVQLLNNLTSFDNLANYNIKPVLQLISKCVIVDLPQIWQFLNENRKLQVEAFDQILQQAQLGSENLSYHNYLKELRQIILTGEIKNAYNIFFATATPGDALQSLCELLLNKSFIQPFMGVQMHKQEQFYLAHLLYNGNEQQFTNFAMQYLLSFLENQDNAKIIEICQGLSQMVFNYAIPITRYEFLNNAFPIQFWVLLVELLCSYNLPYYIQKQILDLLRIIKLLSVQNFFGQLELYQMVFHKFQYILMYDKPNSGFILRLFQNYPGIFQQNYVQQNNILLRQQDIRSQFVQHLQMILKDDLANYKNLSNKILHDYYNNLYSLIVAFLIADQNCRIVHFVGGGRLIVDNLLFVLEVADDECKASALQMGTLLLQFQTGELFSDTAIEQLYQQLQQNLRGVIGSFAAPRLLVLFGYLFCILAQGKNNCNEVVSSLQNIISRYSQLHSIDCFEEIQCLMIQSLHFVKQQLRAGQKISDPEINLLISEISELDFVQVSLLLLTQLFEVKLINQAVSQVSGNLDFYLKNQSDTPRLYQLVSQCCQSLNGQIVQNQMQNVGFQQNIIFIFSLLSVLLQAEESFMHPLSQLLLNAFQRVPVSTRYIELLYAKLDELARKISLTEEEAARTQVTHSELMTVLVAPDLQKRTTLLTKVIQQYVGNRLLDQKGFECNLQVLSLFKEQIPLLFNSFKGSEKEEEASMLLEKMLVFIYLNLRFLRQNNFILITKRQIRDIIVIKGTILQQLENIPDLQIIVHELSQVIKE